MPWKLTAGKTVCIALSALGALPAMPQAAPAPDAAALHERVMVVYNAGAPDSRAVAKHYLASRQIPQANVCRISVQATEHLPLSEYETRIKQPVRKCLERIGKQRILYIVLAYNTPFLVMDGEDGYALDQFVADIWDEYASGPAGGRSPAHPYFGRALSGQNVYDDFVSLAAYRARPQALNIYSVWRLDAATPALAKGLVDKAIFAEKNGLVGKGCFDRINRMANAADSGASAGDWDIYRAAEFARRAGFEVVEDESNAEFGTAPAPLRCGGAALYAGWYSLSNYNDAFTWVPGAIGFHLDSASATNPRGDSNWSAMAVRKGLTVTSGAVGEPYLEGLAHPDQFFRDLFQGANAGDAVLRATRWLKWRIINIGDPLYRPLLSGNRN
jgi:uncharacterized protein (TIGR03790 family)